MSMFTALTLREIETLITACHFTDTEKEVFLKRTEGMTIEEIAYQTAMSDSTVKRRLADIKAKMRKVGA